MAVESKTTLIVKHLPSSLTTDDKTDLLKHFGATMVRCMGNNGKMKNCAFATFSDHQSARRGLERLHQLELLDCTLSAEFSKQPKYHEHVADTFPDIKQEKECKVNKSDVSKDNTANDDETLLSQKLNSLCSSWGFSYPLNPKLHYLYPPPNPVILANMANALAAVPKFYVQVLHLMNKMNLPAPFGPATPMPPLESVVQNASYLPPLPPDEPHPPQPPKEPHTSNQSDLERTSEESEMESEEDESRKITNEATPLQPKKRLSNLKGPSAKRMKLHNLIHPPKPSGYTKTVTATEDIFEQVQGSLSRKIELKMPDILSDPLKQVSDVGETEQKEQFEEESKENIVSGFGQIVPKTVSPDNDDQGSSSPDSWGKTDFISSGKLKKGRLSQAELNELSVFRKYQAGDRSSRLYLKNLSKQVSEKDLHFIYGRYVCWEDNIEKLMFDIRLMKEGRMKGQAFVTLPSEDAANKALEETNGFVLYDKPIVVQFARSAKSKDKG